SQVHKAVDIVIAHSRRVLVGLVVVLQPGVEVGQVHKAVQVAVAFQGLRDDQAVGIHGLAAKVGAASPQIVVVNHNHTVGGIGGGAGANDVLEGRRRDLTGQSLFYGQFRAGGCFHNQGVVLDIELADGGRREG